jgi:hypothetical protein
MNKHKVIILREITLSKGCMNAPLNSDEPTKLGFKLLCIRTVQGLDPKQCQSLMSANTCHMVSERHTD